ncbi:hypothetical protein 30B_00009 [Ralstonia phage Jenny]|uniref:Uncharacterized protein n=1 Tax=Ralstonia phage Jenny TaxID=2759714 RepID=A0A7G5BB43_9CAUD|nr:hypothetical protein 30B_00009 [Ralstonia phage Jenny]
MKTIEIKGWLYARQGWGVATQTEILVDPV